MDTDDFKIPEKDRQKELSRRLFLKALRKSYLKKSLSLRDSAVKKTIEQIKTQPNIFEVETRQSLPNTDFQKLCNLTELKDQMQDFEKRQDGKLKDVINKNQRILKHENYEQTMLEEMKHNLDKNQKDLRHISDEISQLEKSNLNTQELENIKNLIKTQMDIVNKRLSELDHKEVALNQKMTKLDEVSSSVKSLIGRMNNLVAEKVERNIRMQQLENKIKQETSTIRKDILEKERKLKQMELQHEMTKHAMPSEEAIIAKSRLDDMKKKIDTYKRYVPAYDEDSDYNDSENRAEKKQAMPKIPVPEPSEKHAVFDDRKLKDVYKKDGKSAFELFENKVDAEEMAGKNYVPEKGKKLDLLKIDFKRFGSLNTEQRERKKGILDFLSFRN